MKIAVLLSGGVDSSVALRLLQKEGHEVVAFYLKIWLEDEMAHLGSCPWEEDLAMARAVCAQAGVRLEVISLQREYHQRVVSWALEELRAGRTPSPDVLCNQRVKFGAFVDLLDRDQELGAGDEAFQIASGHYARLGVDAGGETLLLRGRDPVKDQTYFLFQLSQQQLRRCLFPIGHLTKLEVRELARSFELANQARKDSQGICFLGKIRYEEFVRCHLGEQPGLIRRVPDGKIVGHHRGHWFYTVGQRKGLGLAGGPYFVVRKEIAENAVWICHGDDLPRHARQHFVVPQPHFTYQAHVLARALGPQRLGVRVRHSPRVVPALVEEREGLLHLHLEEADPGIAPGQVAVLYDGDICLGGGQIELTW